MSTDDPITLDEYRALAEFRYRLRRFLAFSETAGREAGLEPQQHQLLLAVQGLPEGAVPTIGVLAERMQIRQHSAGELVDRASQAGLVERRAGAEDRRVVIVVLTAKGQEILQSLSVAHRAELRALGPGLVEALGTLLGAAHAS